MKTTVNSHGGAIHIAVAVPNRNNRTACGRVIHNDDSPGILSDMYPHAFRACRVCLKIDAELQAQIVADTEAHKAAWRQASHASRNPESYDDDREAGLY